MESRISFFFKTQERLLILRLSFFVIGSSFFRADLMDRIEDSSCCLLESKTFWTEETISKASLAATLRSLAESHVSGRSTISLRSSFFLTRPFFQKWSMKKFTTCLYSERTCFKTDCFLMVKSDKEHLVDRLIFMFSFFVLAIFCHRVYQKNLNFFLANSS